MSKPLNKIPYKVSPRSAHSPDLTNNIFNSFLVIKYLGVSKKGNVWQCRCECGTILELTTGYLREPKLRHCGCKYVNWSTTHSMSNTRIYRIWCAMISRCHNPNVRNYTNYGGRGITVCDEWRNSFETFYDDMIDGYSDDLSIDRINNNGDYIKENCKWSTRIEQSRNTRNNSWHTIDGITKCKNDWATELGISHHRINEKLRNGYTFQQIYNHYIKKPKRSARIKKYDNE